MLTITINPEDSPEHIYSCAQALITYGKTMSRVMTEDKPEMTAAQYMQTIAAEDKPDTGAMSAAEAFADKANSLHIVGDVHFTGHGQIDPASVFGATGKPVPSIAAAEAFATAPGGTLDTSTNQTAYQTPAHQSASVAATVAPQVQPGSHAPAVSGQPPLLLDNDGLPWDERIHAGTKTQTQGGTWKAKRGVDANLVAAVTAELKAKVSAGLPPFVPLNHTMPIEQAAPSAPPPPPAAMGNVPPPPPAQYQQPAANVPPPPSGAVAPSTFQELAMWITPHSVGANPKLNMTIINDVVREHTGLPLFNLLQSNPQHIPAVYQALAARVQ